MLTELKILNGILELKFDKYTYEYTVLVEEDIKRLDFEYLTTDNVSVNIRNNYIYDGEGLVYVDVINNDNIITYTFSTHKETTNLVSGIDDYKKSLELTKIDNIELYEIQILCSGVFIIIVIIFCLIFRKKHT